MNELELKYGCNPNQKPARIFMENGELPLKDYLKTLEEYDYDGIVDLEINDSIYWDDPHESIRKSVEWLKAEL